MNQSFENIFEKYNIICNVPKKPKKKSETSKQSYALQKNASDTLRGNKCSTKKDSGHFKTTSSRITNSTTNLNSSFYFNTSAKEKYYCATRYKTLEIIGLQNLSKPIKYSTTNFFLSSENICFAGESSHKENCIENKRNNEYNTDNNINKMDLSFNEFNTCDNLENINTKSLKDETHNLSCSFNFGRRKQGSKSRVQTQCLRYNKLNVTVIPKLSTNCTSFKKSSNTNCLSLNHSDNILSDSTKPSQIIDTPTLTQQSDDNVTTELDLLIELIEREEKDKRKKETQKQKVSNSNSDILPPTKPCLKGGYEELFERILKRETVRGNFLKHDRKIGLRTGKLLSVVEMKTTYGLTIAVVKSEDLHKNFGVVVAQEMVTHLKSGTQIEAFFDDKTLPYKLQYNEDYLDIYLEPYKLLII